MNRLWVRLTLAFVVVIVVTVATTAAIATLRTDLQFREFLRRPDSWARSGLPDMLVAYYEQAGSWEGVDAWIVDNQPPPSGDPEGIPHKQPPFLLADANSRIFYALGSERIGQALAGAEQSSAQSLVVDGVIVGYVTRDLDRPGAMAGPELDFLSQLRVSLLIAGVVASLLGLAFGLVISRTLAAPLAMLARAARAFAAHDWHQRVSLRKRTSVVEIAEVAHAFNDMAGSLQEAETLRRNLIADVAHELRTPLAVLQGNLNALLDGVYPLELSEIGALYDQTRLLTRVVEDLHNLAAAEAGQLPLYPHTVEVEPLLQATATKFTAAADALQVSLDVYVPDGTPPVYADPDRTTQVLQNLVGNALRHTPAGTHVALRACVDEAAHGVQFSVSDTGEGIPAADLPFIFERFYRGDKSRARHTGNTGLGLTIAKTLVESMCGKIGVESTPGQGSRFWFTLPIS